MSTPSTAPASPSPSIHIHTLVVLAIADHYTRTMRQSDAPAGSSSQDVFGLLFGTVSGTTVEAYETVEFPYRLPHDQQPVIDREQLQGDIDLFVQCFPSYTCVGWYSTSASSTSSAARTAHEQYVRQHLQLQYPQANFYLQLNPAKALQAATAINLVNSAETLPITVHRFGSNYTTADWKIDSDVVESLTAIFCQQNADTAMKGGKTAAHAATVEQGVLALQTRVAVLGQYLQDVASGKVPADADILRQVQHVVNQLPTDNSADFTRQFYKEYNDALLIQQLSAVTSGSALVYDVTQKFTVIDQAKSRKKELAMHSRHYRDYTNTDDDMQGGSLRSMLGFNQ